MAEKEQSTPEPVLLNLTFGSPWAILRPTVYRFLEKSYVDEFFEHGRIRLSSFSRFAKHDDEQRHDSSEGKAVSFLTDSESTVALGAGVGFDSYILCGSTSSAETVASAFSDSAIVIENTTEFAAAIARALPHYMNGLEGNCTYRSNRVIERRLPQGRIKEMWDTNKQEDGTINMDILRDVIKPVSIDLLFLKEEKYAQQLEYRFVWRCAHIEDYIDLVVPDARRFCSPLELPAQKP